MRCGIERGRSNGVAIYPEMRDINVSTVVYLLQSYIRKGLVNKSFVPVKVFHVPFGFFLGHCLCC